MDLVESVWMSWRSIRGHKLRSALTTLGVIIGVAAVIVFVTLGTSLQADIVGDVTGTQEPVVSVWAGPDEAGPPGEGAEPVFTERDVRQLNRTRGVERVLPRGQVATAGFSGGGGALAFGGITATPPAAFNSTEFETGRAYRSGAREMVVNRATLDLFDRNVSVGERFEIALADGRTLNTTLVGILNDSAFSSLSGAGGPAVFVPTDPYYNVSRASPTTGESQRVYPFLTVETADFERLDPARDRMGAYLGNRSDARQLKADAFVFRLQTNEELLDQLEEILGTLTDFVTAIAAVSLLVGSIGIANIMLVSVTERTREIGIMKATGARRRDILQVFIVEAVLLGIIGAVLGAIVGALGSYGVAEYVDLPLVLDPTLFAGAVFVGIVVGVLAGAYPAWRAARTDPIDALRHE